jgi:hypothetical protein
MNEEIQRLEHERDALLGAWKPKPPPENDSPRQQSPDADQMWRRLRGWLKGHVPWGIRDR